MKFLIKNSRKGFTLVELMVAISLFIIIVIISIGAILTIFDANKKSQSSKTVVDNLNLAIEDMTRTIRFGGYYYCGVSSNQTAFNDCSTGGTSVSVTFNGSRIVYRLNGTALQRSDDGGSNYISVTSPETVIEYLRFYVFGSDPTDNNQPYVIAVIKGYSGIKPTNQTKFSLQTIMSQRALDI